MTQYDLTERKTWLLILEFAHFLVHSIETAMCFRLKKRLHQHSPHTEIKCCRKEMTEGCMHQEHLTCFKLKTKKQPLTYLSNKSITD